MNLFKKVLFLIVAQVIVITVCLYLHLDDFNIENDLNSNTIIEENKNKTVENILSKNVTKMKNDDEPIVKIKTENLTSTKEKTKNKTTVSPADIKPAEIKSKKVIEQNNKKIDLKTQTKRDLKLNLKLNLKSDEKIQKEINEIISKNRIIFKRLSTDATTKSIKTIEKIANILKENSHIKVEVAGFTDARGDDKVNAYISKHRALSVKKILIKLGVDKDRLTSRGYGESHPIVKNDPQGYSIENRRVEFKIVKE